MPNYTATKITDGLNFGVGTIASSGIDTSLLEQVEAVIQSDAILVPVDHDGMGAFVADDGCGDGRPVGLVFEGELQRRYSLHRPKVFGGGATMMAAILIGTGQAQSQPLSALFVQAMAAMAQKGLTYGGHTDDGAQAPACGCGAIDKAPQIIAAAHEYQANIKDVVAVLGISVAEIEEVFAQFAAYGQSLSADDEYSGKAVIDAMLANNKVVKQLIGDHKEAFIVLNTVKGATVNQGVARDVTDGAVQVFGVDVWRLQQIADMLPEPQQHQALLAELVYTLATAAVLTRGDLPVFVVEKNADQS